MFKFKMLICLILLLKIGITANTIDDFLVNYPIGSDVSEHQDLNAINSTKESCFFPLPIQHAYYDCAGVIDKRATKNEKQFEITVFSNVNKVNSVTFQRLKFLETFDDYSGLKI